MLTYRELSKMILSFEAMSHKKMQKIAFYSQAWYYTLYGKKLINENFEAWVHGPVCPEIYQEYKSYGWNLIPKTDFKSENSEINEFMEVVFNTFGEFSGDELEAMTHNEDPWIIARKGLKPYEASSNIIKLEDMKEFCSKLIDQNQVE